MGDANRYERQDLVVDCAEDRKESRMMSGLLGWGFGKLELMHCSVL